MRIGLQPMYNLFERVENGPSTSLLFGLSLNLAQLLANQVRIMNLKGLFGML